MANKKVTELPTNTSPSGAEIYAVEGGNDYRLPVGGNNGISFLGATGLVPTANLGTGTADGTKYLRGDGTWAVVAGGGGGGGGTGTVTSVAVANATGISWTGGPITSNGTLTPALSVNLQNWSGIAPSDKANTSHTHSINDINATGTRDSTTYLRGDGTWSTPAGGGGGGGTVTSVNVANATGITFTGGPITGGGTLTPALSANLQAWSGVAIGDKANTSHTHAAGDIASGVMATARLGTGTANSTTYLRGDGTWSSIASSGTVTSVSMSGGTTGLAFTGGPVTTSGTFTATGTLAIANGGTGSGTAATALSNLGGAPTANPDFTGTIDLAGAGSFYGDSAYMRFTNAIRSGSTTNDQKLTADAATWVNVPRVFVQAGDPGTFAADGDLWVF